MRGPETHDLRAASPESLLESIASLWDEQPGGLLTVSRRPSKRWTEAATFARPLVLSSAALFELVLWTPRSSEQPIPQDLHSELLSLLSDYKSFFSSPERESARLYIQKLEQHVHSQEATLYSTMAQIPHLDRAVRELRYEHQGLIRGLDGLRLAQEGALANSLEKRAKDRLDLDFFHLLEHHLEREIEALYPAWIFLNQG